MSRKRKTLQFDGLNLDNGLIVDRACLVDQIIQTAEVNQHVIIVSPPATGKSSLLSLVEAKLEECNERVIYFAPLGNSERMETMFREHGFSMGDLSALRKVERAWIIVDDAQRGYTEFFDDMWAFLIKDLAARNRNIKVIIAATHDMSTLGSPAAIRTLPHVFRNFSRAEVDDLIGQFCRNFDVPQYQEDWVDYWNTVKELSLLDVPIETGAAHTPSEFHVGVVVRCLLHLEKQRKIPKATFDGNVAQQELRKSAFVRGFDRCFAVDTNMIKDPTVRSTITGALLDETSEREELPESLRPLVRAGVLTTKGGFTCQAASWFYGQIHFPNRAERVPESLPALVVGAVRKFSTSRLQSCVHGGKFPLETCFQHLLNEAMTCLLPSGNSVKPEYRTKAQGFLGDTKRGFIDFYINDSIQWALELLRLGKGLTEHRNRFHPIARKYRTLPTKKHLVVDIRGPIEDGREEASHDLCIIYFSADWTSCTIQMEMEAPFEVSLRL